VNDPKRQGRGAWSTYGLVLLWAVPLLLLLSLGLVYLKSEAERRQAQAQTRVASTLLGRPPQALSGVEAELAQVEKEWQQLQGQFVVGGTDRVVRDLWDRVKQSGLELVGISAPASLRPEEGKAGIPITFHLKGEVSQLLVFLKSVDLPNLEVQRVSLVQGLEGKTPEITVGFLLYLPPRE